MGSAGEVGGEGEEIPDRGAGERGEARKHLELKELKARGKKSVGEYVKEGGIEKASFVSRYLGEVWNPHPTPPRRILPKLKRN